MAIAPPQVAERGRILVRGVVQGVGFRPFVHELARTHGLAGFVYNDGRGVVIEAEGLPGALDQLTGDLRSKPPPLARVESVATSRLAPRGENDFVVDASRGERGDALIPPDAATCEDCLREL